MGIKMEGKQRYVIFLGLLNSYLEKQFGFPSYSVRISIVESQKRLLRIIGNMFKFCWLIRTD